MRMLRSLGRNETDRLFGDLMSGRTSLAREALLAARARTDRGEGDDKIITLGRDANGESRFGLGITLVHEAFRDGEIGDDQAGETERAVLGHVDAAEEVMNGYGKRALGAAQREEVQYIRFMQAMGDNAKISEYVQGRYDSSADYWKLAQDADGNWGWQEDGSLDFDVSALPLDKQKIIKEALKLKGAGFTEDGRVRHQDMDNIIVNIIASGVQLEVEKLKPGIISREEEVFSAESTRDRLRLGTQSFINTSKIIESMMPERVTVEKLNALDKTLLETQKSKLLVQNPANINTEGLVNVGSSEEPLYVPVRLRPSDNDHRVTSYPNSRILWSRPDLGITHHPGIDIGSVHNSDVVTSADKSSARLTWTPIYGLSAITPYKREGNSFDNALGHLEVKKTMMDYLKAFGTKGVTATERGLTNIQAGMVIGQVGNTGYSLGAHLDWRIFSDGQRIDPLKSNYYGQYLSNTHVTRTARLLSNFPGGDPMEAWRNRETHLRIMAFILDPPDIARPYVNTKWYLELIKSMENR